jgi:hypothetical protein
MAPELTAKRLDILKEMVPAASRVAVLWDPGYSAFSLEWQVLRERARVEGVTHQPLALAAGAADHHGGVGGLFGASMLPIS